MHRDTPVEVQGNLDEPLLVTRSPISDIPLADNPVLQDPGNSAALKKVALSFKHLLTHKPSNPYCAHCKIGKSRDRKKYKNKFNRIIELFGDIITADHVDMNDLGVFPNYFAKKRALVIKDLATKFMWVSQYQTKKLMKHSLH